MHYNYIILHLNYNRLSNNNKNKSRYLRTYVKEQIILESNEFITQHNSTQVTSECQNFQNVVYFISKANNFLTYLFEKINVFKYTLLF